MITRLRQLFTVRYPYPNPLDLQRAQILVWVSAIVAFFMLGWVLLGIVPQLQQRSTTLSTDFAVAAIILLASLMIYRLVAVGRLQAASWLCVGTLLLNAFILTILSNFTGRAAIIGTNVIVLSIPLVAAGMLLERRSMLVALLALLAIIIYGALGQSQITATVTLQPANRVLLDFVVLALSLGVIFLFLVVIAGSFQALAGRSVEAMQQRQWIGRFGLELTQASDEKMLQAKALERLRQNFPQLLVEWYILDERGYLIRSGRQVERERNSIPLSANNILAEAARAGTMVTTSVNDNTLRRSHLAASTAFAAALPIRDGETVTGILDVQSSTPFSNDQLSVLTLLAEQVGLALQQARRLSSLQTNVHSQEATISRLQSQLEASERRRRQSVQDTWRSYIQGRGKPIIGYSLDALNATPTPISELPARLAASLKGGEIQIEQVGDEQLIHVPIIFRDYPLGAMSFAVPADQPLSERQVEVARTVADRLALALENTRLFEQTQAQAQRERKANEIASMLIGATDVRVVLNLAAENFKDALGAVNTHIYIQPDFLAEAPTRTATEAAP
jgi:GAF domain-containing protein